MFNFVTKTLSHSHSRSCSRLVSFSTLNQINHAHKQHQHTQNIFQRAFSTTTREPFDLNKLTTREEGEFGTREYTLYFEYEEKGNKKIISPWHDIPYKTETPGFFHFINEIPKGTSHKMEISTELENNPIKHDIKKDQIRIITKGPLLYNYGCIPQTWEDPDHTSTGTQFPGDNDPIDVVEIGSVVAKRGEVYPIKVLGVFGLIDEGETDWKIIGIRHDDVLAPHMNEFSDVNTFRPSLLEVIHDFYATYKVVDGKPPNTYAFQGRPLKKKFAVQVIEDTHKMWELLRKKKLQVKK